MGQTKLRFAIGSPLLKQQSEVLAKVLNVGLIGGGMMMQVAHLPFWKADPRVRIIGLAESRPSLVTHLTQHYPDIPIIEDYRTLLEDPTIDTIVSVTPRAANAHVAYDILSSGKNAVTEKPMAYTLDQGKSLEQAANKAGRRHLIGFMKRYDQGVQMCRALLDQLSNDGTLGLMLHAHFFHHCAESIIAPPPHQRPKESRDQRFTCWPLFPENLTSLNQVIYDWYINALIHDINLIRFLLGNSLVVEDASLHNQALIKVNFRTPAVPISFEASRSNGGDWHEGANFYFEKGRITLHLPPPFDMHNSGQVTIQSKITSLPSGLDKRPGWAFAHQAADFITALCQNRPSLSDGHDCIQDLTLTETIWDMIKQRGSL